MISRVICVGNRYAQEDSAGPLALEALAGMEIPPGVEVIEGGLAGIDLLPMVESADRVVFVDSVKGFTDEGGQVVMDALAAAGGVDAAYGHGGGLAYLLKVLPRVVDGPLPELVLVGLEGPADQDKARSLARSALAAAVSGIVKKPNQKHVEVGPR